MSLSEFSIFPRLPPLTRLTPEPGNADLGGHFFGSRTASLHCFLQVIIPPNVTGPVKRPQATGEAQTP